MVIFGFVKVLASKGSDDKPNKVGKVLMVFYICTYHH